MKATKLPSGNYRVRAYYKDSAGKIHRKSFTDPDRKVALALAQDYVASAQKIEEPDRGTFKEAMHAFLASREPVLSPSTMKGYISMSKVLEAAHGEFCRTPLRDIRGDDIQRVINALAMVHPPAQKFQKQPRPASPKTIRNYAGFISSVLRSQGYLMPAVNLPEKTRAKITVPDNDTMSRIIASTEGTELEIPVKLAAFAPLRRGEICALRMDDFHGNVVHVSRDMVIDSAGVWHIKPPKTFESDRYVELPQSLVDLIRKDGKITDMNPDELSKVFRKHLARNGFDQIRFHDLRHWCASFLHSTGMPDAYIMKRGGWSTDGTLKNVYRHTLADQDRVHTAHALESFEALF